ncbi:hypothetical protein [Halorhabdus rudnickae]|uniref:hypothetical protein n=1 Tax=Halorhabdus rudnickae TaxID=1775544 RepID=UPI001FCEA52D|nr:hypothetical protein [Halorhabdus rudnickae]
MASIVWSLTRTELRTTVRATLENSRQLIGLGTLAVMSLVFPMMFWGSIAEFGREAAGGTVPVGTLAAGYIGVGFSGLYLGFVGGFNQSRVGVVGPLIRTSMAPRAVAIGQFATRTVEGLAAIVPFGIVLLVIVGQGAGGPLVPILVGLGAIPVLAAGLVVGRTLGDCSRYVNDRLQVSLWVRAALFLAVMIALFVGSQVALASVFDDESALEPGSIGAILPGEPVQAYAGVVCSLFGAAIEPLGVAVAAALLVVGPVGFLVAIRLETHMLLGDVGDSETPGVEGTDGVPRLFDLTPASRIAWRYLLRTRRDPRTLAHLMPVLFGALGMTGTALEDPHTLLTVGPPGTVIAGSILAGGAFCLNPLGDDRDQLPLLLTSTSEIGPLLRGRMLAGIALGLVVAIGIGAPFGLIEYTPAFVLGQSLLATILVVVAAGTALGLGAAVPKFERREYMNVERAHPSLLITIAFFMGGIIVGAIGIVLLWVTITESRRGGITLLAVYAAVLGLVAAGGYWYATRRFRAISLDRW